MWNDTDIPLAYLITFRCYGTWLHGDERGSIDRTHNHFRTPYLPPDERRLTHNVRKLKGEPTFLDAERRTVVADALREVCLVLDWLLHAVNVRTNHVHLVTSI